MARRAVFADGVKLTLLRQECGANDKYGSWEPVKEAPVLTVDEKNNWESTFGITTSFRTHDLNQKPYKYTVTESAVGARGSLENYNCKVTQEVSGEAIRLIATNTLKAKHALTITKERKGSQATTQAAIYQFKLFFDKGFKVSEQEIKDHAANGLTLSAINGAKTLYQFSLTVPENATSASISVNVMEGIRFDLIEDTAGLDDCFVQYFLDSSWQDQKPGTGIVGAVMGTQDRQALVQNNYYGNDGIVIAKQATGKDGGVVPVDGKYTFLIKFWTAKSEEQTNTEWMKDVKANLEAKNAVVSGLLSGSSVSLAALQTAVASKGAAQAETNVAQAQYAAAKAALEKQLTVETASGSGVITTDQAMKAIAEAVAATEKESAELESQLLSKQEQLSGLAGNVSGAAIGEGETVDTDAEKIAQLEKEIAALQQKLKDLQEKKAELVGQKEAIEQALSACDAAAATLTAKEAALEAAKQSVVALQGNMSEDAWNALLGATEEQLAAQNAYEMRQAGKNDAEDGILAQIRKAIVGFINFIQGISSSREDITGKVVPLTKGEDGYVFELKSSEEIAYKLQEYMKDHPGETIYYSVEETQNGGANATSIKDAAGNIQEGKIWRGEVTNLDEMVKTRITFTNTFDQKPVDPSPDPVEPAPNPDSGHRPRPDPIPEPIPELIPPLVEIEEIKIPIGEAGEVMDPSQEKSKEVSIKEGNVPLGALPKTGGMGVLGFLAAGAILAGLGIHIKRKEDK